MPTGYTDMIDRNPKLSTKDWVMTGIARAFGVCIALKEEPWGLNEEQIRQKIAKSGESDVAWHQNELIKATELKVIYNGRTESEWEAAWRNWEEEKKKLNEKSIAEAKKIAQIHERVRKDLEKILASNADKFTKDIANYGLEQLKITQHECEPYLTTPKTLATFEREAIASNLRDIEYHTEEMQKAKERMDERVKAYMTLRKDLDAIFP